jgi:hypothetical protein
MKRITHKATAREKVLNVEADGVLVTIEVGLRDDRNHPVTRVDVIPDGPTRHGSSDLVWVQDGARFVRLRDGEAPDAIHRQAIETAASALLGLLDRTVPHSTIHFAVEDARLALKTLAFHAKHLKLSASSPEEAARQD